MTAPLGIYFPCQFVLSVGDDILGFCYHKPSVCKYFSEYSTQPQLDLSVSLITLIVNLSAICRTTDLVSPYASIQPVGRLYFLYFYHV
jgi:hypothetical protein